MTKFIHVRDMVARLSGRGDITVNTEKGTWVIRIPKGPDFVCEVAVPIDWCFEWHACVRPAAGKEHIWHDWMEHYGSPHEALDAEMAASIEAFVVRVAGSELKLPLRIHAEKS
jgi:hypothetical protein